MFACVLVFCVVIYAQDDSASTNEKIKIVEDKPAVYISVKCKDEKNVGLRVHNNTIWAIAVPTFSFYLDPQNVKRTFLHDGFSVFALPDDKDISSLLYFVEKRKIQEGKIILEISTYAGDSFNMSWIAAADSIFFLIPVDRLKESSYIYINFKYEWETSRKGNFDPNELENRVYFRKSNIDDYENPIPCEEE